jgi:prepilin-type N-terminal cleavage/methylation domain-containing protein
MRNVNLIKRGFTVLELLVVIGIIVLLMALMGTILTKLRERTKMAQAKTLIEKCYSGIEQYHMTWRAYPLDTAPGGLTGDRALYYYLSTTFSPNPIAANGEVWADTYGASCTTFQAYEVRPNSGGGSDIVDPFTMAIVYKVMTQTDQYGVVTFMPVLYSCGVNKTDDGGPPPYGTPNNDDIYIGK